MPRGASCAATTLFALALGADLARAHNGYGIAPIYSEPFGLIVSDGLTPIVLRWTAREAHPEQWYRIKAQQSDFPPTPSPPSRMRLGQELTRLPAEHLEYTVTVDPSALPTGAWRLYAEFDEPPSCVELEQVPALFVVRKDGDPPPFGVIVGEPLLDSPIVDDRATIAIEAISGEPLSVTIEAGEIVRDPDFPPLTLCVEFTWSETLEVVRDMPLVADDSAGPDRWRAELDWDTRAVPDGAYLLRVTARQDSGATQTIWARRWINVEHAVVADPGPEAGPEAVEPDPTEPEAGVPDPSEGAVEVESIDARDGSNDDTGCGAGPGPALGWLAIAAVLAGSRRRARTDRSRRPGRSAGAGSSSR